MSYYHKYRPQKAGDLDLQVAREALEAILRTGKFSHAYLFAGPKGTGKTSSARILAKILNCQKNKERLGNEGLVEPCNKCSECKAITQGSGVTVIEMDAASNRGIDDIRDLKEKVVLSPPEGLMVVYVIDEVHMLTKEAFNAFLKTLEEPPEHAVFVLCTTEEHKLPDTIISRCTKVAFRKASIDEVEKSLLKVVKGENLDVENGVIKAIASRVDGSFRDGMKILEQMSQSGGKISIELADKFTGYGDDYNPEKLVKHLINKEAKEALHELKNKYDRGIEAGVLATRLVEYTSEKMLEIVVEKKKNEADVDTWRSLTELFMNATWEIKEAVLVEVPLELAIVKWCFETEDGIEQQVVVEDRKEEKKIEEPLEKPKEAKVVIPKKRIKGGSASLDDVKHHWGGVLSGVRPHNHSLEALLKATQPVDIDEDRLTIEVFYNFHKEQLEQDRHRKIIEEVIGDVVGIPYKLYFVLGKNKSKAKQTESNVTGKLGDEDLAKAAEEIFT